MQDFRKLRVWHESVEIAVEIYHTTNALPASERFGLRSQLRSAAVSVSSNIAEGCGRPGRGDLARFLGIAIGSVCEIESQLLVSRKLGLLDAQLVDRLLGRIDGLKRRLISLYSRVKTSSGVFPEAPAPKGGTTYHIPPTT